MTKKGTGTTSEMNRFRRWPLVAYFILAYVISWGGILAVVGLEGIPSDVAPDEEVAIMVVAAQFLGPFLAGIGLSVIVDGTDGLRDLWRRQRRVRVSIKWYAIALGTTPVILAVSAGVLSAISPAFTPGILTTEDKLSLIAFGIVAGLVVPFFEETGWTGFALPRLRLRYSVVVGGIILGVIWGVWHGLADFWGTSYVYGEIWTLRIGGWIVALTAYRVVIAWIYEHTESLLLAQLAHTGFIFGQAVFEPTASSPRTYLIWYGVFAVVLWTIVGVIWTRRASQ